MSTPKITGLRSADAIPVGATLVRSYWTVPIYGTHLECGSQTAALESAIERAAEAQQRSSLIDFEPRVWIDLRWQMKWPADHGAGVYTSGLDSTVERWEFETIADARACLDRIVTLAKRPLVVTPPSRVRQDLGL